jgi:hypothetical protein
VVEEVGIFIGPCKLGEKVRNINAVLLEIAALSIVGILNLSENQNQDWKELKQL